MEEADEPPLSPNTDRIQSSARLSASERRHPSRPPSPRPASVGHVPLSSTPRPQQSSPLTREYDTADQHDGEPKSRNPVSDFTSAIPPPPAPPPNNTKDIGEKDTSVEPAEKPAWSHRIKAGIRRFYTHLKDAIFHSWINVLLIFVPVGIAVDFLPLPSQVHSTVAFSINAIAIVPLAGLLAHATESVSLSMGDTWASLLNVTFGNAVELIIFIIALAKNQIVTVQAAILGSILANLLLILGMAFLFGGLRFQEQIYNSTVTQMSACLLSLSVTSLLLPVSCLDYTFYQKLTILQDCFPRLIR